MQQVLDDKQRLRDIIAQQQNVIAEKDSAIAQKDSIIIQKDEALTQKDEQIAQLLQRIADLEKPTAVTTVAGNYIGEMQVHNMNIASSLPQFRKRKSKILTTDNLQLPLWQTS